MKNNRGITLVSLVVLIIVAIILVGVSMNSVYNEEIKDKVKDAQQMNDEAIEQTEENEKDILKQNIQEFRVSETVSE